MTLLGVFSVLAIIAMIIGPSQRPSQKDGILPPSKRTNKSSQAIPSVPQPNQENVVRPEEDAHTREPLLPPVEPTPATERTAEPGWRTWTDATGNHKTEAQFKGMGFGKVKLLKRDGQEIIIPLDKLSIEDQEWM